MSVRPSAVCGERVVLGYGSAVAVADSSFSIPQGSVAAVIGPNGSGKSTLLNAIAGLREPMAGKLDVPARTEGTHRIAYVLQTTNVNDALPITVGEVVAMARYASLGFHRRPDATDRAAVDEAMHRTGIESMSGKHLLELSGGQRCLGHQSIAQHFGASVVRAERLMHGRTSEIHHEGRGVFDSLPTPLTATRYHSLIVERDSIPDEIEVTAWTDQGEVMGLRHTTLPIEGVQFHPESFLTQHGHDLIRNWLSTLPASTAS